MPWLKTRRHEYARTYQERCPQSFWRIWALVQKVKIRRLRLSPHVADLAGVRNLKKVGNVEFEVVKWLQSMNHDLSRLSAPARRILQLLKYLVYAGIVPQRLRNSWVKSSRRNSGHDSLALLFAAEIKTSDGSDVPAWTASPLRPGRGTVSSTWTKCFCRRPFRALKTLPILPSAFGRIIRKRFLVWSNEHLKLLINLSHRSP